ncbi:hypothetical protein U729_3112 (plasmid) [Clostridium baratii str. Sullivan]|uniref:Uncharacterized protein n=1 Tax=Clostridium baratii str. Sullivan TaxID=1415775 RepID=A0A0A7FZZ8_9CLOT|nr:hypothetical protein [Clostridium baratii]AIY85204.1 hypothetical protein U729_3112 [Clostridium baratii str. Sullivan]
MDLELFTVYFKEDGKINIVINENVISAYGMTLEEFEKKIKLDNLYKGIRDFCEPLWGASNE